MAYSAGFTPHPRISYANAAPTGAASEAEYLEIAVTARCDAQRLRAVLDEALPPGLDVVDVVEARTSGFAERLEASVWWVELPGVAPDAARAALAASLAAAGGGGGGRRKSGMRPFAAGGGVGGGGVTGGAAWGWGGGGPKGTGGACAILPLVVRHPPPAVRPDDVLSALRSH